MTDDDETGELSFAQLQKEAQRAAPRYPEKYGTCACGFGWSWIVNLQQVVYGGCTFCGVAHVIGYSLFDPDAAESSDEVLFEKMLWIAAQHDLLAQGEFMTTRSEHRCAAVCGEEIVAGNQPAETLAPTGDDNAAASARNRPMTIAELEQSINERFGSPGERGTFSARAHAEVRRRDEEKRRADNPPVIPPTPAELEEWARTLSAESFEERLRRERLAEFFEMQHPEMFWEPYPGEKVKWSRAECGRRIRAGAPYRSFFRLQARGK